MLPSVSEVLRELTARAPIEPDVAFRAARDVCAEELKRIRDAGGESVPIEVLVERALARVGGVPPPLVVAPPPPFVPVEPSEPEPLPAASESVAEDPFSETTGALDLRWDREAREPLGASAAVVPVEDEPPLPPPVEEAAEPWALAGTAEPAADAAPPDAEQETLPTEEGGDVVFALPEDDSATAPAPPAAGMPEEFGDETLTRLSREAEAIDLRSVFAGDGVSSGTSTYAEGAKVGAQAAPTAEPIEEASGASEPPPPFEDDEDTVLTIPRGGRRRAEGEDGPRWGRLAGIAAVLAVLAALGYLLVGLWIDRGAETGGRVAVTRRTPAEAVPALVPPAGAATPATPDTGAQPEAPAAGPSAAIAPPPGKAEPTPVATAVPPSPTAPATAVPAVVPAPSAPVASVSPAPVRQSRDGLVVTRDRAGRPEVFSIHFTSYRDRAAAERDLKRIAALAGREGYVAEVDLGEKGVWYRVLVGEFPSAEEAKAVRAELAAKGTRDMGWVYRVVGP
jgi:hypothetical protein